MVKFEARFALYEYVAIDRDDSIVGVVTAVQFRSIREPTYEVSWIANGDAKVGWIEESRLEVAVKS
jgi:hypothetical protein